MPKLRPIYPNFLLSPLGATGVQAVAVSTKTGSHTATVNDWVIICNASSGALTITLPPAAGLEAVVYHIKKIDSNANIVTIDGNGSETIDDATTASITTQYENVMIVCDGSNWHII